MNGTILGGRYELIEIIGEGGMAKVYKARCRILDRIVAVKILKEEFSRDKGFVEKFKTEALSAARITHPNIVNIYDVGQENDVHYIVMEYVDGQTLKDIIRREAPLTIDKAVDIAIMICDGIHHAHEKGIVHRDIKPHNILITEHGMVKVADFGIARAMSNATITYGNNIVGSVHYISPEQAKGDPINRTTDIYSVGCVLFEMLSGKVPFDAESPITVALKHIHDEPPSLKALNIAVPAGLEAIIYKAMQKLPSQRYATAEDMRNAMLNLHGHRSDYKLQHRNEKTMVMNPISEERDENGLVKKKRKIRPLGIAIIAIAIIGLLAGIIFTAGDGLFGKEVAVPNVVGMDYDKAFEELKKVNLVLKKEASENSDKYEKDKIISQEPVKGMKVKEGKEIKVIISLGSELITVPNVTGIDIKDAYIKAGNADLNIASKIDERYDDQIPEGVVISQDPLKGSRVKAGTSITVSVSKGKQPDRVAMPELRGLSLEQARNKLEDLKLAQGEIKRQESTEYYIDKVAEQEIAAGVMVEQGTAIKLTISNGPGPVSKTKALEFKLPSDQEYYKVLIKVTDTNGTREVYNKLHRSGDVIYAGITYSGSGTAEVFLNNKSVKIYPLP